ncbi:unnamed protein product [Aphanomyces euteiches]
MENVELLRKRSSRLIALNNSSFDKSGADDSLYDLARSNKWDDLENALCGEVSGDKLNAKDKRTVQPQPIMFAARAIRRF